MNKPLALIASLSLVVAASNVFAASSVDLTVTGVITPSACTPQLSAGGIVDHGKISISDLKNGMNPLEKVTLQMSVNCNAAIPFAILSTDNRENSATNANQQSTRSLFGLGFSEDGQKLGNYVLTMDNAMADGMASPIVEAINRDTWFSAPADQIWQPGWMRSVSAPGTPGNVPVPVQTLVTDLVIATSIKKPTMTTEEISLDGSATLSIVYL